LDAKLIEPLGGGLTEFVPSALYKFADNNKVIAPAKRDYLRNSTDGVAAAAYHQVQTKQDLIGLFDCL
jgi:hypothetical protein